MPLPSTAKVYKKAAFKHLSEVLINFDSILLFLKKIVLKAAFYSNPTPHFKHLQQRNSWGNLQIFIRALLLNRYVKNVLFIY